MLNNVMRQKIELVWIFLKGRNKPVKTKVTTNYFWAQLDAALAVIIFFNLKNNRERENTHISNGVPASNIFFVWRNRSDFPGMSTYGTQLSNASNFWFPGGKISLNSWKSFLCSKGNGRIFINSFCLKGMM